MSQNPYQQPPEPAQYPPQQNPYAAPTSNVTGGDTYGTQGDVAQSTIRILSATKGWSRFLAVVFFVLGGFSIIGAFDGGNVPGMRGNTGTGVLLSLALTMVFFIIPGLYMNSYASKIGTLVMNPSTVTLDTALNVQRAVFKCFGIIAIIFIGFIVFIMLYVRSF